ncbi:MAG: glycosyltransferase family A protein, partial [Pseudomonadota bacterium]
RDRIVFSVVMPVYNRERSVRRAVDSLKLETAEVFELIVVDDGSSDGSAAAAREAAAGLPPDRVKIIEQDNAGPGAARNRGAAAATGAYLVFADSDDLWYPWTAEVVAAEMETRRPALAFLRTVDYRAGEMPPVQTQGPSGVEDHAGYLEAVASDPPVRFASCNVLIRRDLFEQAGGFATALRCAEDTDLFLRLADKGGCAVISAPAMVAHEMERGDNLTGEANSVIAGVNHVVSTDAGGGYGGDQGLRNALIAKLVANAVKTAFAEGDAAAAYGFLLRRFSLLWRGRNWRWMIRLPIYPLLAILRPNSFAFRWR